MKNTILITGATGFLGQKLVERLYGRVDPETGNWVTIRVASRDEGKLLDLKMKYPNIEVWTGDIADDYFTERICKGADSCFHLAAFKHVGQAQDQPYECYRSNVQGTANVLRHFKGSYFLMTSTDKAAQVSGVYGASKLLAEHLIHAQEKHQPRTKYRIVRYGNVLYSTGSVLCKWKELIQKGEPITITDPNATRYFWTVDEAIDLIFKCGEQAKDSTPFCPEMKAMSIGDLLSAMLQKYWEFWDDRRDYEINEMGLQPGENLHEKITEDGIPSNEAEQYTIEEIMELI